MRRTIFISLLTVSLVTLLLVLPLSLLLYYNTYEERIKEDLTVELGYVSSLYERGVRDDALSQNGRRVTIISSNGSVIYDSAADEERMDNHLEREEVKEALERGIGMSERKSKTLSEKSIYCALRLNDGNVLRLSSEAKTAFSFLSMIILPLLLVIVIAFIMVFFLSRAVSSRIVKPINSLNLDEPDKNETYDELSPLLLKLKKEKDEIENQIRKSEEKRRESELIFSSLEEGLAIVNSSGELLSSNSSFFALLGGKAKENTTIFSYFQDGEGKSAVLSALSGKRKEVVLSISGRMIEEAAYPSEKGIIILLRDVTERVMRENMRREFTANVSHELKTPLTTISGFAELLMSGNVPPDKAVEFSGDIYRETKRLSTLVDDILNLSSLDEGSEKEESLIDLKSVGESVINELSLKAEKRNVKIIPSLESASVKGSEKLVHEIVYNLVDNAIRYSKDRDAYVRIATKRTGKSVILSVEDNGIGIEEEHQKRVFERFYRVDKARSNSSGGTGLGLSIVKNAALRLGGTIHLESTPGKGTTITITFPSGL